MLSPAISIGDRDDIVRVGEVIPDLRVVAKEIFGLSRSRYEPDLLGDPEFDGNLSKGEKGEPVLAYVERKCQAGNGLGLVTRALIRLLDAFLHYLPKRFLIYLVEVGHDG